MKSYMDWKYELSTTRSTSPMEVDPSTAIPPSGNYDFELPVLDIYTLDTSVTIPCPGEELPIAALVKNGYLGNTPATPSLAISLKTLELFRRIRLRKSSFSVEAFVKVVCDLYAVCTRSPWCRRLQLMPLASRFHTAGAIVLHWAMHLKSIS